MKQLKDYYKETPQIHPDQCEFLELSEEFINYELKKDTNKNKRKNSQKLETVQLS